MEFSEWLMIVTVCGLGAISPGPSFVVVVRQTVKNGRFGGIVAGLAHGVGIGIYAAITVAGLGFAVQSSWLLLALRWAGVAFLLYIAVQLLRGKGGSTDVSFEQLPRASSSLWGSARDGFLIAFLNPKVLLFFTALFSQFLRPAFTWSEKSIMVFTAMAIDAGWYFLVAIAISLPTVLALFKRREVILNRIFGGVLVLIALKLLFDPLSDK